MYSYILIILLVAPDLFHRQNKRRPVQSAERSIKVVMEPKDDEKSISSFQALMVSTASRVGNREYCRNFHSSLHWRSRSYVLDVADRASGKRICVH